MSRPTADSAPATDAAAQGSLRSRVREAVARRVGIDGRALAALRIALGALLLVDLLLRARFLRAFYTDAGVLPRALLRAQHPTFAALSIHTLSGDLWLQALLFVVAGALAVSLLVGYRTRTVTLCSWLLLVSLHARNPVVLNAGDSVLRRLLFWSVFLPLGGRWSVDALRSATPARSTDPERQGTTDAVADRPSRVVSVASAALLVQVVLVYATNAVYKHRGPAWQDGTATLHVLQLEQFSVLLGDVLANYPALVRPLGEFWLLLVTLSPLLLVLTGHGRGLLAGAIAGMHLGMLLTLQIGLFPLISVASVLPFLPPAWWGVVERRVAAPLRARLAGTRLTGALPERPAATRAGQARPSRARAWGHRLVTVVVAVLLVTVLVWNAMAVGLVETPDPVESTVPPGDMTWNMFAPHPPTAAAWHVVPATLASGAEVDAFQRAPVRWHPDEPDRLYPSARWRKYLADSAGNDALQRGFGAYLCRRWNADHDGDREMEHLVLVVVREPTNLDDHAAETRTRIGQERVNCTTG